MKHWHSCAIVLNIINNTLTFVDKNNNSMYKHRTLNKINCKQSYPSKHVYPTHLKQTCVRRQWHLHQAFRVASKRRFHFTQSGWASENFEHPRWSCQVWATHSEHIEQKRRHFCSLSARRLRSILKRLSDTDCCKTNESDWTNRETLALYIKAPFRYRLL